VYVMYAFMGIGGRGTLRVQETRSGLKRGWVLKTLKFRSVIDITCATTIFCLSLCVLRVTGHCGVCVLLPLASGQ
jgi:hypothetical protein